jgi:excisionase family DNA binding protein
MSKNQMTWERAPDLLTVTQAAQLSQTHINTIRRWLKDGTLAGSQTPGGHWRIARADLAALVLPAAKEIDYEAEYFRLATGLERIIRAQTIDDAREIAYELLGPESVDQIMYEREQDQAKATPRRYRPNYR